MSSVDDDGDAELFLELKQEVIEILTLCASTDPNGSSIRRISG